MTTTQEGGCLCGQIRYQASGEPLAVALCHCSFCRKASGAPAVAWALYPEDSVKVSSGEPRTHASSDGVRRQFCPDCGTQLLFAADYIPGLVDITTASLDNPNALPPAMHIWDASRLDWLQLADDLPRHVAFPPEA